MNDNDLISRAAVKQAFIQYKRDMKVLTPFELNRLVDLFAIIKDLPAVDAVPVVHAKWIDYPECLGYEGAYHDEHIVCSACQSVWNIIDNDADRFDYCPSCGAKMDGEREEQNGHDNDSPADH